MEALFFMEELESDFGSCYCIKGKKNFCKLMNCLDSVVQACQGLYRVRPSMFKKSFVLRVARG